MISLREIKPSSPGLDPSNALRSCATHGQLDPTPWGPRALDPPVDLAHTTTKWDVHHAGLARYRQGVVGG